MGTTVGFVQDSEQITASFRHKGEEVFVQSFEIKVNSPYFDL